MQINSLQSAIKSHNTFGAIHHGVDENGVRRSELVVNLPHGVHMRPATNIVELTRLNSGDVFVTNKNNERTSVTGSVLSLIMLILAHGDHIILKTNENYP